MTPERYQRVSELIERMFDSETTRWPELLGVAERLDPGIREDAERLLALRDSSDGFLERPLVIPPPSPFHEDPRDPFGILGTTIDDTYEIEELIGRGGMGAVYRGRHTRLPRDVAIKMVRRDLVHYLSIEGAAGCKINHPNVVAVTDWRILPTGESYLVMEYIDGESLRQALRRVPHPSLESTCGIVTQVADALDAAHQAGFVHRDVKPENILIASSGKRGTRVRVIDFGIALDIRDAGVVDMLDDTGNPGTPRYMSPEQWRPGIPVGPASDIFSLGLVTFEMLAGEPAFRAGDVGTIREQVTRGEFKVLGEISSGVPDHVVACVEKALSLDPQDRYESARDFAKALTAPVRRQPTVIYRESVSARDLRDAVSPFVDVDEAMASYISTELPVGAPRARRPAHERVVAASLRALERVDIVTTFGMTSVELYLGDLLAIPRDWHVDVLAVTSLPDGFTAAPGTVSATIKKHGVDASRLTRDEQGAVHLSEPEVLLRGKRHQGKPAAGQRIRGIELGDESDPKRQVDNMFRALGDMYGPGSLPGIVAMPLAELMADRPPAANVARPVLEAVMDWLGRGVNLSRLIVVESDPAAAEVARDALLNAVGR